MKLKYTKNMPIKLKKFFFTLFIIISGFAQLAYTPIAQAYEGIEVYYLRYDIKSSNNKIIADNLLMIPAKNDFRVEKFSLFSTTGVISASPGEPRISLEKQIKENSIKSILMQNGLKSVTSKDYDTVISYEGAMITPLKIIKNTYHQEQESYFYSAQIKFSPIAFPDQWEKKSIKSKFKKMFSEFFQLFQ